MSASSSIFFRSRTAMTALAVAGTLVLSTACVTAERAGQIGGGLAGGILGAALGGSTTSRVLLAAGGAVAGAWLGGAFGRYLEEQDRRNAEQAFADSATTGETITWDNPETGVSGTARVKNSTKRSETTQVAVLKDRIETVPEIDFIGEDRTARSGSNVRGGPGTDYRVVDTLVAGQTVEVVGRVQGSNWLMIAQDGAGSGFVREDLLAAAPTQTAQARAATLEERTNALEQRVAAGDVGTVSVQAERECRQIEQEIVLADGSSEIETITSCRGPNGWELA